MLNGTMTARMSLGTVTDLYLRHEKRNVLLVVETDHDLQLRFRTHGLNPQALNWMKGKELFQESNSNGSHVMLNGFCICTVKQTVIEGIFYPSAANYIVRKLTEREQESE